MKIKAVIMSMCLAVVTLLALAPNHIGGAASRAGGGPVAVHTAWRGLSVGLTVRRSTYPRNALIRVTVVISNHSKWLATSWQNCPLLTDPVTAHVLHSDGTLAPFSLPLAPGESSLCPGPGTFILRPGDTWRSSLFVVLAGQFLQAEASVTLSEPDGPAAPDPYDLTTPKVRIRLLPESPPRVVLQRTPRVRAVLHPASAQPGPLRYNDWYRCAGHADQVLTGTRVPWTPLENESQTFIEPGCPDPLEWHATAGWPGQPVVRIDYVQPGQRMPQRTPAEQMPPGGVTG